jgi:death-on-curing protein
MKTLTKTQVIKMHQLLIQETGGNEGIRDEGLLDSALNAPFQT